MCHPVFVVVHSTGKMQTLPLIKKSYARSDGISLSSTRVLHSKASQRTDGTHQEEPICRRSRYEGLDTSVKSVEASLKLRVKPRPVLTIILDLVLVRSNRISFSSTNFGAKPVAILLATNALPKCKAEERSDESVIAVLEVERVFSLSSHTQRCHSALFSINAPFRSICHRQFDLATERLPHHKTSDADPESRSFDDRFDALLQCSSQWS
jgi:hypothetical protein